MSWGRRCVARRWLAYVDRDCCINGRHICGSLQVLESKLRTSASRWRLLLV